jgi:hypothetical protein
VPDVTGLEALPSTRPLLLTLAIRPEEIELAFSTNGDSLRTRLLLALVAELAILELAGTSEPLDPFIHGSVAHNGFFLVENVD